jgi:hypothetical protein
MAILSKEVRAIQNPALGSVLIWRAASSYQKNHPTGSFMPLPLSFLILPVLFHEETSALVAGTRTSSAIMLSRSPQPACVRGGRGRPRQLYWPLGFRSANNKATRSVSDAMHNLCSA